MNLIKGIILFILFSFNTCLLSQSKWVWQNPLPQGNDLRVVKFADAETGWTTGDKGTIMKTIDGGLNWSILNSGVNENLNDIYILSDQRIIIIGDYGVILNTTNGGSNWSLMLAEENPVLEKIIFTDNSNGWICGRKLNYHGGFIYKTTDAGANWNLNFFHAEDEFFDKIFFWDSNTGITGGDWYTYKTTDAGINWIRQDYTINGNEIQYNDFSNGLLIGGYETGYIRKTTNGGINYFYSINTGDTVLNSLFMNDTATGYVAGRNGKILRTTNYGDTWDNLISSTNENLNSIFFSDNNSGYAVGNLSTLISSTDAGSNWSKHQTGLTDLFSSGVFQNQFTGWVSGPFRVIRTTNGGLNWYIAWDSASYSNLYPLIQFTDNDNGWLIYNPNVYDFRVYKSTNSGNNWTLKLPLPNLISIFNLIQYFSSIIIQDLLRDHLRNFSGQQYLYMDLYIKQLTRGVRGYAHNLGIAL